MSLSVDGVNSQNIASKSNIRKEKAVQFAKSTAGVATGAVIYKKLPKLIKNAMKPYKNRCMQALTSNSSPQEIETVKNAVQKAFVQTGLKEQGFNIHNINSKDRVFTVSKDMSDKLDKIVERKFGGIKKILPEKLANKLGLNKPPGAGQKFLINSLEKVLDGKNAFCTSGTKDIAVNLEKIPLTTFHEMGHGLNSLQKSERMLVKSRLPLQYIGVPIILTAALLKGKKSKEEKPQGSFDKSTTFIKDNAGKLTFAAWIPTLLEEGLASIKGAKMAKDAGLSKELLKKLNISNAKAWSTYMIGALAAASTVRLAVAVKDRIAEGINLKNKSLTEKTQA